MFKKILAIMALLYAAASFAAVEVNKATPAELDSVKGIGPAISTRIVDERKKGSFKDWNDFVSRVKGVGEGSAAKFSAEGLTVNGAAFKGAAAAKTADKAEKKAAKDEKKETQAAAKEDKKDAKVAAKTDDKKDSKTDAAKPAASAASAASAAKK
jgi:competence protein ComEA